MCNIEHKNKQICSWYEYLEQEKEHVMIAKRVINPIMVVDHMYGFFTV